MKQVEEREQLTPGAMLSHIISVHHEAAELLASIGLKPSTQKDQTLRSVCQQRQWSKVEVLDWVKKYTNGADTALPNGNSKNVPGACSTLCILNTNFKLLKEKLEAQLNFENEQLIPRIERELNKAS